MNSRKFPSFEDFMINYDPENYEMGLQKSKTKYEGIEQNLLDDIERLIQKDNKVDQFIKSLKKIHEKYK